jgi:hypothetical protein
LRFHLEQCLLPQFHCVFGKVCRGCIRGSGLFISESFRNNKDRQTQTNRKKSPHVKAPASFIRFGAFRQAQFSEVHHRVAPKAFRGLVVPYLTLSPISSAAQYRIVLEMSIIRLWIIERVMQPAAFFAA